MDFRQILVDHLEVIKTRTGPLPIDRLAHKATSPGGQHYDTTGAAVAAGHAEAVDTVIGYTGKLFDDDTELQNNLNRWYDAKVERWVSEEPIGCAGGDANLFRYVANAAMSSLDPDGLRNFEFDEYGELKEVLEPWEMQPGPRDGTDGLQDYLQNFSKEFLEELCKPLLDELNKWNPFNKPDVDPEIFEGPGSPWDFDIRPGSLPEGGIGIIIEAKV